jgi:HEAT repeat protein
MNLEKLLSAFPLPDQNRQILSNIDKDAMEKSIAEMMDSPSEAARGLVALLKDPEKEPGADIQARHAIHAIAIRIPAKDQKKRAQYAEALASTLADERPDAVKAFVIRQIQVCGGKEVIPHVGKFLNIDGIADDAAQALVAIGGDEAVNQFRSALAKAEKGSTLRKHHLHGLADLSDKGSKDAFLSALEDENVDIRLLGLWGLVQIADKSTIDPFLKAEQTEKGFARNKAAHLCLLFAEKVKGADARKIYQHLAKTRTDKTETHLVELAKAHLE